MSKSNLYELMISWYVFQLQRKFKTKEQANRTSISQHNRSEKNKSLLRRIDKPPKQPETLTMVEFERTPTLPSWSPKSYSQLTTPIPH